MHDEQNIEPCNEPTPEAGVVPGQEEDTDVFSLIEDVERHLSRIRNAQSKQVQEFTDLASRQQAMEQAEQALAGDAEKIKADQSALDQERASIEQLRVESQKASSVVEEAEKELDLRSKEVNCELDSLREGRVALSQGEEDLEARSEELRHEAEQLNERMAELETQREEMLAQHSEMESLLATNMNRLEQAESELEECLERAESADTRCQSLDERCGFLTEDSKKVRSQLRKAGERLSELADVVSTQAPQLEEGAAAMASLQEQARMIASLEQKLIQETSSQGDSGELREECAQAKKRADELEEALVIAQDRGQAQEFAKKLRSKAESLSDFARHLELRKSRLEILRKGVRENARSGEDSTTFRDMQRLKSKKDDLEQARQCLVESEKAMLSKWARPRALAASVWLSFLIFCVGGGSWLVVENMLSSPGTATVDLVASTRSGRPLENMALVDWMEWHEALPRDPAFVHVVSSPSFCSRYCSCRRGRSRSALARQRSGLR